MKLKIILGILLTFGMYTMLNAQETPDTNDKETFDPTQTKIKIALFLYGPDNYQLKDEVYATLIERIEAHEGFVYAALEEVERVAQEKSHLQRNNWSEWFRVLGETLECDYVFAGKLHQKNNAPVLDVYMMDIEKAAPVDEISLQGNKEFILRNVYRFFESQFDLTFPQPVIPVTEEEPEPIIIIEKEIVEPEPEPIRTEIIYPLKKYRWLGYGTGILGLGTGILLTSLSFAFEKDADDLYSTYTNELTTATWTEANQYYQDAVSKQDRAYSMRGLSWVGYGAALTGLGVGLFFRFYKKEVLEKEISVNLLFRDQQRGVAISLKF